MAKIRFYVSKGNSKVNLPIVNTGSGTDCPNRFICPYSATNRGINCPLCYAQRGEAFRPNILVSRRRNADFIRQSFLNGTTLALVEYVADKVVKYSEGRKTCRINEAGDIDASNVSFIVALVKALKKRGIKSYTYSKSADQLIELVRSAGATVLKSEESFIVLRKGEVLPQGEKLCGGKCGKGFCMRCPSGKKTYVNAH